MSIWITGSRVGASLSDLYVVEDSIIACSTGYEARKNGVIYRRTQTSEASWKLLVLYQLYVTKLNRADTQRSLHSSPIQSIKPDLSPRNGKLNTIYRDSSKNKTPEPRS
jgi:hypothetical protein